MAASYERSEHARSSGSLSSSAENLGRSFAQSGGSEVSCINIGDGHRLESAEQPNADALQPRASLSDTATRLQQLRRRRREREGQEWDMEDNELEEMQLDNVTVLVNRSSSVGTEESTPFASGLSCPVEKAPSSVEFENVIFVPYEAQYRRVVEGEDDAEMQQLLRQLSEERQAIRELAAAQRYKLMQEQLMLIQKQLGRENSRAPDLDWLLGDEPENDHELEEVLAAFAARDADLPEEASDVPDVPLTCKNFFCRCPWRRDLRKDERAIRWALICCPLGMPLALGVIMSLCSIKKRQSVVKALAWLSCALFTLFFGVLILCLAIFLTNEFHAIREGMAENTGPPGFEWGVGTENTNPYNAFTTTQCGLLGTHINIEHASRTHTLNQEIFGTVVFIGLSRANTWGIMGLLDLAFEHDFDALAITPPGHGNTTEVDNDGGGFWSAANFLKTALESCMGISLAKTVVVSHSNFVTRKFFFPLLISELILGFVLFDSSVGTEWMDEYDPDIDDHKFYQVRTRHFRYVGNRRLAALESIVHAGGGQEDADGTKLDIVPVSAHEINSPLEGAAPRVLSATSLKGFCRAEPEGEDDSFPEKTTIGPFDFFPGKYKSPGWNTARQRLREIPLDQPADEGMQTRLVGSEYFDPLRVALRSFLEELKRLSLDEKLQVEQPRPLRFNNRQVQYDASREKTTKIDPRSVYCVESLTRIQPNPASITEYQMSNVHLVDPNKY
ncbi:hypothetical protein Esti_001151 [Eimeria stiedai]